MVGIFATQILLAILNFPAGLIVARLLGPSGLGTYQFLYRFAFLVLAIGQLGYLHAWTWAVAESKTVDDRQRHFRGAVRVACMQGCTIAAVGAVAYPWFGSRFGLMAWASIVLYPLFNLLAAHLANCYRGLLLPAQFAGIRLSQGVVWVIVITCIATFGSLTIETTVIALVSAQAASAIVGLAISAFGGLLKRPRNPDLVRRSSRREVRRFALKAWPAMAIRDCNVYLDQIIVGLFLDTRELGYYAAAVSLTTTLGLLSAPITNATQPSLQRARNLEEQRHAAAVSITTCVLVVAIAGAAAALAASAVVPLLYGPAFVASIPLVQILSVAVTLDNVNSCLHGVLLGLERPGLSSRSVSYGFALSVVGWIFTLPLLGVVGAALTSLFAYAVVLAVMFSHVSAALKYRRRDLVRRCGNVVGEAVTLLMRVLKARRTKEVGQ